MGGPVSHLTDRDRRVFDILVAAVNAGEKCPSNSNLAHRIGCISTSDPSDIIRRLQRSGLITVDRGSCNRVVTIVATGKSTAGKVTAPHWRERTADVERPRPSPVRAVAKSPSPADPLARDQNLAARIDADQHRLRAQRECWLAIEQERYRLPRRGRLIEEMPA